MKTKRKYIKKVVVADALSSPEARAERLRRVRNLANLSRRDMCSDGRININTLKGWEIARYGGLPQDGAEKVVQRIAREGVVCTVDWLLHEVGVGPYVIQDFGKAEHAPVESIASTQLSDENTLIINELLLFRNQYKNILDFEVEDDGLAPFYQIGDTVAGILYRGTEIKRLIGMDCIVRTNEGRTLLRHLRIGNTADTYQLCCTNLETTVDRPMLYDVELVCAAPVIRHYRMRV